LIIDIFIVPVESWCRLALYQTKPSDGCWGYYNRHLQLPDIHSGTPLIVCICEERCSFCAIWAV
jgi:hypothetical protein